ncbi:MAG: ubiquinol-cytochrome c reductase iron-sulfur subunit [Proteobacteria bacterium]|nr:ubiquinol-cytochrome c reductase iron-sulfur subunit [Pseudomonadota bacterium]
MDHEQTRRSFLGKSLTILAGAGAVVTGWAAFRFVFSGQGAKHRGGPLAGEAFSRGDGPGGSGPALTANPDGSFSLAADAVPQGFSMILALGAVPVMVLHGDRGVRAFAATCTHLGCLVRWNPDTNLFECPCHGGKYDAAGRVIAGPPPMDLAEYKVEATDQEIRILMA